MEIRKRKLNSDIMEYFEFNKHWVPIFRMLNPGERAILLNLIFWNCFEGLPITEGYLKTKSQPFNIAWNTIKGDLDSQFAEWRECCSNSTD